MGSNLAAICAQLEASVVEQPAAAGLCAGARGFLTGGSCAPEGVAETAKQRRNKTTHEGKDECLIGCTPRCKLICAAGVRI